MSETVYCYALIEKSSGKRITGFGRKNNNLLGLYRSRVGPSQLLVGMNKDEYQIIKYEVTLTPVETEK